MVSSIEIKSESSLDTEQTKPESNFSLEYSYSKIRFSQQINEYHDILSRESYSERELRHCWYTEEEKTKLIDRHERSAKKLEKGERSKRGESFRGLEGWTEAGADEANEMIEDCIDAVLNEQDRQMKKDRRNHGNLALISLSKSKKAIKMALRTAKRDMKEAIRAYESMGIEDLDLDSGSSSISSLIASPPTPDEVESDENESDDKPRRTEKRDRRRRSTSSQRRSYRSRGEHKRTKRSGSTSRGGGVERIQKAVPLE